MKAANGYNKTKVTESDVGKGIHNQVKGDFREHKVATDHSARNKSTAPQFPNPDQKHEGFQFGSNPIKEDSFEKS